MRKHELIYMYQLSAFEQNVSREIWKGSWLILPIDRPDTFLSFDIVPEED